MPNHSSKKPKLPTDINQRGKTIVDFLTRDRDAEPVVETQAETPETKPIPDAVREAARALGKRGGLKGGVSRAKKLSAEQRSEIAKRAAEARWAAAARVRPTEETGDTET